MTKWTLLAGLTILLGNAGCIVGDVSGALKIATALWDIASILGL